eukprot:Protomagalhaensia_sp_Gyna_25__306@NODE_1143_length_2144_cov_41_680760_g908_i0_p1_GENE_NODE_1143_length_2144_cov_41_680760_g908_i0NODE_1143_length_2144_cov_41_680760_g908_i0_p1_ORF_typecomplete_len363_score54_73Fbox/PF00646_33/0_0029Fboxlike/PF12937_7/0_029Fboxlike/PF12937_7/1_2e04_NODE_1143_length_2144_cov_41_680760_g908_i01431231
MGDWGFREEWLKLVAFLPARDRRRLSQVCRGFREEILRYEWEVEALLETIRKLSYGTDKSMATALVEKLDCYEFDLTSDHHAAIRRETLEEAIKSWHLAESLVDRYCLGRHHGMEPSFDFPVGGICIEDRYESKPRQFNEVGRQTARHPGSGYMAALQWLHSTPCVQKEEEAWELIGRAIQESLAINSIDVYSMAAVSLLKYFPTWREHAFTHPMRLIFWTLGICYPEMPTREAAFLALQNSVRLIHWTEFYSWPYILQPKDHLPTEGQKAITDASKIKAICKAIKLTWAREFATSLAIKRRLYRKGLRPYEDIKGLLYLYCVQIETSFRSGTVSATVHLHGSITASLEIKVPVPEVKQVVI